LRIIQQTDLSLLFERPESLVVLETGTGFDNPLSAPLLLTGIRQLLLLEPYVGARADHHRLQERLRYLVDCAESDPEFPLSRRQTVSDLFGQNSKPHQMPANVQILDRFWEDTGLPDGSVDLILSASVLEHLRKPDAVLRESSRILRPDGWMLHLVDLRDHFFRYPFEMLKYSPRAWSLLTTHTGGSGFQNRWRLPQWLDALEQCGFNTQVIPQLTLRDEMLLERPFFHSDFQGFSDGDLQIAVAILVSRRGSTVNLPTQS